MQLLVECIDMDKAKKMPLTGAERAKRCREKKKATNPAFQGEESKRIEALRKEKVNRMSVNEKKQYRAKVAERVRRCKLKKAGELKGKEEIHNQLVNHPSRQAPYSRPQSLGKAVRKAFRNLPVSPRKKIAVVSGLASRVGIELSSKMSNHMNPSSQEMSAGLKSLINDFYFRSDIVYTMPGLKDEMVIWINGKNTGKKRKYYLTMFLREAYAIFKLSHPEPTVCFSKFCALRPKNVLLLKNTPMDQCKCKHHENFILRLKGLNQVYDESWWMKYLCSSDDLESSCWMNDCDKCKDGKLFDLDMDSSVPVVWQEWEKDHYGHLVKKLYDETCAGELYEIILQNWANFQEHTRVKRMQATAFQEDMSISTNRVLQIDFAMAYSCEYQNEVQSALWSRASVQLLTAAVFVNGKCSTFIICSDTKDKGKDSVCCFLLTLYQKLFQGESNCISQNEATEIIYSDGPSAEFKNKYMVKLLHLLSEKYNKKFIWKYFATSHGKGVVDGLGGSAKSLVRTKTKSKGDGAVVVQSSVEFAKLAEQLMPATTVLHISDHEIKELVKSIDPWQDVSGIPGIQSMHVIQVSPDQNAKLWHTNGPFVAGVAPDIVEDGIMHTELPSTSTCAEGHNQRQWCSNRYNDITKYISCYVIVQLQTVAKRAVYYLGHIMDVNSNSSVLKIQYLRKKSGKDTYFVFPEKDDFDEVDVSTVHSVLNTKPKERRGKLFFPKHALFNLLE